MISLSSQRFKQVVPSLVLIFLSSLIIEACSTRPHPTLQLQADGKAAYVQQRYQDSITILSKYKHKLSPESQFYLAMSYVYEKDIDRYIDASSLLQEAANSGYADAAWELARGYEEGTFTEIDPLKALDWYRTHSALASQQQTIKTNQYFDVEGNEILALQMREKLRTSASEGNKDAQLQLAKIYSDGINTEKDLSRSLHWYEKAAALGDNHASLMTGYYYCRGLGTTKNPMTADSWLKKFDSTLNCK